MQDLQPQALNSHSSIPFRLTLICRFLHCQFSRPVFPHHYSDFIFTMCIRWCCKHCIDKLTKLTHRWAYERCNEYFIARSKDENISSCPRGPWELRRAYHRHPYRGPQRCDQCKNASRKEKKRMQSARQKANVAMGHRPDYNGAIYLGELEIQESTNRGSQPLLEPSKLDAMRMKWENFNVSHRHLPSHELEREWTKKFTAFKYVDPEAGTIPRPSKIASTVEQRVSHKDVCQATTALAGEKSRNPPHQQTYRHSTSKRHEPNGISPPTANVFIQCNPNSTTKRRASTLEAFSMTKQHERYKQNIDPAVDTKEPVFIPTKEIPLRITEHQQHFPYKFRLGVTHKGNYPTLVETNPSQDAERGGVHSTCTITAHSSSSQRTRTRPWDL